MALLVRDNGQVVPRWDPFAELNRLGTQLERYFEAGPTGSLDAFIPLADVEETDDAFVIEADLPGVRRGDVSVEVDGRRVTVTGERKEQERKGILRRNNRLIGRFHYELMLPTDVLGEKVEARLVDGVLTIRIPKVQRAESRRIEVK